MKDYIAELKDDEIKQMLIHYLKLVNFSSLGGVKNIEDISINRDVGYEDAQIEAIIYFSHPLKKNPHDTEVEVENFLDGLKRENVCLNFFLNSFEMSACGPIYDYNTDTIFCEDSEYETGLELVEKDQTFIWNSFMVKRFGKEYLMDLKAYKEQLLEREMEERRQEIEHDLKIVENSKNKLKDFYK